RILNRNVRIDADDLPKFTSRGFVTRSDRVEHGILVDRLQGGSIAAAFIQLRTSDNKFEGNLPANPGSPRPIRHAFIGSLGGLAASILIGGSRIQSRNLPGRAVRSFAHGH